MDRYCTRCGHRFYYCTCPPHAEITLAPAPRPATKAAEDAYLVQAFGKALNECLDILGAPGSPSLTDVPRLLRERLGEES